MPYSSGVFVVICSLVMKIVSPRGPRTRMASNTLSTGQCSLLSCSTAESKLFQSWYNTLVAMLGMINTRNYIFILTERNTRASHLGDKNTVPWKSYLGSGLS